jgi:hypothetical protein
MGSSRSNLGKKFSDPRGGHIRLYWEIMDSNAYRSLSATDQRAYLALQRQSKSTNNGDLSLPLSKSRESGITSPATLAKSLRALVAVGLLAVTRKGGCKSGGQRLPTLYRFTDREAYAHPVKNIEASKATNEWKAVKSLAMGAALIRKAEDAAKITQLQKLAVTASKNELVSPLTASIIEVWTPSPTSIIEAGESVKTGLNPNTHAGFKKSNDFTNSGNHTSNNEVLSTITNHTGKLGLLAVVPAVVQPASTGTDSLDASATLTTGPTPAATGSSTTRAETPAVQHALVAALDDTDDGEDF